MTREELAKDVVASLREPRWRDIILVYGFSSNVRLDCGHAALATKIDLAMGMVNCLECE